MSDTPIGEQLGREDTYKHYVVCIECAKQLDHTDSKVYLAMFGPQGRTDEEAILICVPWDGDHFISLGSKPFICDGCDEMVAVARSSNWFIEEHRKEREV